MKFDEQVPATSIAWPFTFWYCSVKLQSESQRLLKDCGNIAHRNFRSHLTTNTLWRYALSKLYRHLTSRITTHRQSFVMFLDLQKLGQMLRAKGYAFRRMQQHPKYSAHQKWYSSALTLAIEHTRDVIEIPSNFAVFAIAAPKVRPMKQAYLNTPVPDNHPRKLTALLMCKWPSQSQTWLEIKVNQNTMWLCHKLQVESSYSRLWYWSLRISSSFHEQRWRRKVAIGFRNQGRWWRIYTNICHTEDQGRGWKGMWV